MMKLIYPSHQVVLVAPMILVLLIPTYQVNIEQSLVHPTTRMMTQATTISLKFHNIIYLLPGSMTILTTIIQQMPRLHHHLLTLPTISMRLPQDPQTPLTLILTTINHTTKTRHNTCRRHHKTTHLMSLRQALSLISSLTLASVRAASQPLRPTTLLTSRTLNLTIPLHIPHLLLLPQVSPLLPLLLLIHHQTGVSMLLPC